MSTMSALPKPAQRHARRLLVRMNTTLFHCLGAAVLLEHAAAPTNASGTQDTRARAQSLFDYAASVWPEFGWKDACAAMRTAGMHLPPVVDERAGEAAAADHVSLFYRALSCVAEDPALCRVLRGIAALEERRRVAASSAACGGPVAALRRVQAMRAFAGHARDRIVRRAFELLEQHWTETPPFPALGYDAFLSRAYVLLAPHLRLDWTRRVLYRVWLTPRGAAVKGARAAAVVRNTAFATQHAPPPRAPACALSRPSMVR